MRKTCKDQEKSIASRCESLQMLRGGDGASERRHERRHERVTGSAKVSVIGKRDGGARMRSGPPDVWMEESIRCRVYFSQ